MGDAVTAIAALVLAHRSAGARTIFSLPPHASVQECRARYKVLARALHPDKQAGASAALHHSCEEAFKVINEAVASLAREEEGRAERPQERWEMHSAAAAPPPRPAVTDEALQAARSRWGARGGAYAAPPAPPVAAQPPLSVSHEEDESVSYGETRLAAIRTAAEDVHASSWAAGGASKWRSAAPVVMLHVTPPDSSDAKDDAAAEPPAQRLVQQRLARQGWEAPARIAPLAQAAPRGNAAASPPREDEEAEEEEERQAAARKRQRRSAHADQPSRRAGAASGGAAIRLGPRPTLAAHLTRRR